MTSTTTISLMTITNAGAAARDLAQHARHELAAHASSPAVLREALAVAQKAAQQLEVATALLVDAVREVERQNDARSSAAQQILTLLETCESADVATVTSRIGSSLYLNVNADGGLNNARATFSGGVHGAHTVYCAGLKPSEFVQRVLAHWQGYCEAQPRPLGELVDAWGC